MNNKDLIFKTPAGTIVGWEDDLVLRATGIPYAYAERFGKPSPFPFFKAPFLAKGKSPAPPQQPSAITDKVLGFDLLDGLTINEHCQYLSITMPKNRKEKDRMPVMIWVYGGSYTTGAGDAAAYDPKYLASEQNVIVVNINYRLGILGFLGGGPGRPSNLGLFDIIASIKWVRKNILAFKGDPDNITLFGQSAGGDAVAQLMLCDGVEGLFKRVIIQSAPLALSHNKQEMIAAMKKMSSGLTADTPLPHIMELQSSITQKMKRYKGGGMPFGVEYGQAPSPAEEETTAVWKRRAKYIDVLIGCGNNELAILTPFSKPLSMLQHIPLIGRPILSALVKKSTSSIYINPATELANTLASQEGTTVYQYLISWGRENGYGAVHIIDIPLLFGDEKTWKRSMLTAGMPWSKVFEDGRQLRAVWGQFSREGHLADHLELPGILVYHRVLR